VPALEKLQVLLPKELVQWQVALPELEQHLKKVIKQVRPPLVAEGTKQILPRRRQVVQQRRQQADLLKKHSMLEKIL
jgi:hypothetical protein